MNRASLYQSANKLQCHDAKQILKEYANVIQWREDGEDALIDIGCGSGNVLMDYIYPLLPENFNKALGTDISAKMVSYARKCYESFERIQFQVLDIAGDDIPGELCESFDHATSFYCLHWVQDQRRALQNIHKLLKPDTGDCLLVMLITCPLFDVYNILCKTAKWSRFMKDVKKFISPLFFMDDPGSEYDRYLEEVGFVDYRVETRNQIFVYENGEGLRDNVKAVCPFLDRMDELDQQEFMDDVMETVVDMKLKEFDEESGEHKYIAPYKLLVAYARKSDRFLTTVIDEDKSKYKGLK